MRFRSPLILIGLAGVLLVGLIVNQVFWVLNSAEQQEKQFNKQVEMALISMEDEFSQDSEVCSSIGCCMDPSTTFCLTYEEGGPEWVMVDSIISSNLERFDIDLNYNFDFCYQGDEQTDEVAHVQRMDKVFEDSGIVLYLEFPDQSKYLMNQIGPVFISSILFIVFLSIAFVMIYRFYRKERAYSQRTRDFINNMTHEFKTPLTNISLANTMIMKGVGQHTDEKLLHYTQIIEDENDRLAKNTNDLLQMAKIEGTKSDFTATIGVHGIIEEVISSAVQVSGDEIEIQAELQADNDLVRGKDSLFYNTIANLVDNAIKYSHGKAEITVRTKNVGSLLHIEVIDKGIGIPKTHLPNIFDKFYRVTEGDEHDVKGFGLGLAYVKMVVNKMKGTVKVLSNPGEGSTFALSIPTTKE